MWKRPPQTTKPHVINTLMVVCCSKFQNQRKIHILIMYHKSAVMVTATAMWYSARPIHDTHTHFYYVHCQLTVAYYSLLYENFVCSLHCANREEYAGCINIHIFKLPPTAPLIWVAWNQMTKDLDQGNPHGRLLVQMASAVCITICTSSCAKLPSWKLWRYPYLPFTRSLYT